MKKIKIIQVFNHNKDLKKIWLIMRLSVFLLFISIFQVSATVYSQVTKLSISQENATITEIFEEIEKQSEFKFLYRKDHIDVNRKINIIVKNHRVEDIMDEILSLYDNVYYTVLEDNLIVITPQQQTHKVTGTVTSASTGETLPGVTILVKGTEIGTITGMDGKYSIEVPDANSVLVFSYVGYITQEININGRSVVDVTLQVSIEALDEVVVVGYGSKRKVNLTAPIATVNLDNLESRPLTNISQALIGTTTGITVLENSSQPGRESSQLLIRGFNTINNSSPLILIDGIVGSIYDVAPNDIKQITILKDPASAAIYGARAANGVILITTKRGETGKMRVNYTGFYSIQEATMLPDLVNDPVQYMEIANTYKINGGLPQFYSDETISEWTNATDRVMYPHTDWLDLVFGNTAGMQSHAVTVNGGTEMARYNVSLRYLDQDGVIQNTNNKKYDFRANFDSKVSDKFSFGINLAGRRQDMVEPGSISSIITAATSTNPMVIPKLNGKYGGPQTNDDGDLYNALMSIETQRTIAENYAFLGNFFVKYNIIKDLSIEVNAAANYGHSMSTQYRITWEKWNFHSTSTTPHQVSTPMELTDYEDRTMTTTLYSLLEYKKTFNNAHNVNVLLGYSGEEYRIDWMRGSISEFPNNFLFELNAGMNELSMKANGSAAENALRSYFGRFSYDFMSKYLLDVNFRYDGSSKFSAVDDLRWGFFPGVSAAWRISEETFMQGVGAVDNLKLRVSWASVGNNQVGNYPYIATYELGTNYSFGGQFVPGISIGEMVNPNLKWETTVSKNIGVDATFLAGMIDLSVDYFDKDTRDMIEGISIPLLTGMGSSQPQKNIGKMSNKGFELALNHQKTINDFRYNVGITFSSFKNKLENYNESVDDISGGFILREGVTVHSLYGWEAVGIFQSTEEIAAHAFQNTVTAPGDLMYKDQLTVDTDNDGVPDASDGIIDGDDRVILGSPLPKFTYGILLNMDYKGFGLSAIFSGSYGAKGYLRGQMMVPLYYPDRGTYVTDWLDHWSPTNTDTDVPAPSQSNLYSAISSYWVHDLSYFKLKNVQLNYTFPQKISSKLRMSQLKLFVNAQNLFVISTFPHFDPERGLRQTGISYPVHRTVSFGVNVNF